ncbi:sugar ABC transporter ATP-binding protein [Peribacillus sp. B-H-3]|uniref:sugar ABC transporter ATP-binding protein n=1 Tax=Peribacillus sp. B-H-3 TaxID=3400420 RepID=UPI003B0282E5
MSAKLLEMKSISKSFGQVKALKKAKFELRAGEVHALLGANGAGKSTLIKILSGVFTEDSGEIVLDGRTVNFRSPKEAKECGIHCVYQEVDTAIVPQLSVAENILLDSFSTERKWFVSRKKMLKQAHDALIQLHAGGISPDKPASALTLAEKQMVLIARALVREAKIIIFDEPTAPLSLEETRHLFEIIQKLKKRGVASIFISHRLPEVFEICDRITVMRDGEAAGTFLAPEITQQQVVDKMLGSQLSMELLRSGSKIGDVLFEVRHLDDDEMLRDISFSVSKGEVVGVVGLVGAGKTELAKALFGLTPWKSGEVLVHGERFRFKHPSQAIKAGLALVPEERRKEGLFIGESVQANITFPHLKKFSNYSFLKKKAEQKYTEEMIDALGIKTHSSQTPVMNLSGGNQQKVAIGKWMSGQAEIYLFDEPAKGVDIGAKKDIFQLIHRLTGSGKGVLYFSCDITEILAVSDRLLVMYDGAIVKELTAAEATQEEILLYASGGKEDGNEREIHRVFI